MPGVASEVRAELSTLEATAPQKYGYLRRHWRAAKRGLDNTDRTFARAADIHANIADPDVDTRTLGYTVQILNRINYNELGIACSLPYIQRSSDNPKIIHQTSWKFR